VVKESDLAGVAERPMPGDTRNPALDGLRGIAILLVLAHHFVADPTHKDLIGRGAYELAYATWCGVDLFFVLSGFLITGILFDSKGSERYFRTFYARRGLRIVPLYYGILLTLFVFVPLAVRYSPAVQAVANRQAWLWCYAVNLNIALESQWLFDAEWLRLGHFWSLSIEEQFYLLWPMLVFLFSRRALMWVCVAAVAAALGVRVTMHWAGVEPTVVYVFTLCRMDALSIGAFLALAVRGAGGIDALLKPVRGTAAASGAALGGIFLAFGSFNENLTAVVTVGYLLLGIFFGSLCLPPASRSPVARCFSLRPLRFFGFYGYGLYVFHVLLMPAFVKLFGAHRLKESLGSPEAAVLGFALLATAGSVAAAWLSWHFYESRFLRWKRCFVYSSTRSGRLPVMTRLQSLSATSAAAGGPHG
jgi:peptidoglycan/LPS O-acetylase OafA/YrhL